MTTEQLRALLPEAPNGPPMAPGWYYCERGHKPHVFVEARRDGTLMAGTGRVIYAYTVTRHAPLPDVTAMQAEIERLRAHIRATGPGMHAVCPECGPHVRIDEEWCCGTCGVDCTPSKCNCADGP